MPNRDKNNLVKWHSKLPVQKRIEFIQFLKSISKAFFYNSLKFNLEVCPIAVYEYNIHIFILSNVYTQICSFYDFA